MRTTRMRNKGICEITPGKNNYEIYLMKMSVSNRQTFSYEFFFIYGCSISFHCKSHTTNTSVAILNNESLCTKVLPLGVVQS